MVHAATDSRRYHVYDRTPVQHTTHTTVVARTRNGGQKEAGGPEGMRNPVQSLPVLVINLHARHDRMEKFIKRGKDLNLRFVQDIKRIDAVCLKVAPHIGCTLSHIRALDHAMKWGYEYVMICEDDCYFTDAAQERFDQVMRELPDDWSVVFGGASGFDVSNVLTHCSVDQENPILSFARYSDHLLVKVLRIGVLTGSHCIIYRNTSVCAVHAQLKRNLERDTHLIPVDRLISSKSPIYIVVPFLAYTLPNDQSDIRDNQNTKNDTTEFIIPTEKELVAVTVSYEEQRALYKAEARASMLSQIEAQWSDYCRELLISDDKTFQFEVECRDGSSIVVRTIHLRKLAMHWLGQTNSDSDAQIHILMGRIRRVMRAHECFATIEESIIHKFGLVLNEITRPGFNNDLYKLKKILRTKNGLDRINVYRVAEKSEFVFELYGVKIDGRSLRRRRTARERRGSQRSDRRSGSSVK